MNIQTLAILFIFVPILAIILLALNLLLAPSRPDESKVSPYECGFSVIQGQTRSVFHIHFYLVSMLFLIFDLEIVLLYPLAVSLYQISTFGFSIAILFFFVLENFTFLIYTFLPIVSKHMKRIASPTPSGIPK